MPFTSLSGRLDRLPLVLAGPMVRRVEPREVTVWLALRQPRKVTLRVYDGDRDGRGQTVRLSGTRSTVAVGENLHVVAVTADKVSGDPLQPERIFSYDLFLSSAGHGADAVDVLETSAETLLAPRVVAGDAKEAGDALLYASAGAPTLPTFAMPPPALIDLRLLHGSCRKPHGGGEDALATADHIIESTLMQPKTRPHQLFLTGDQIYADDVADALLAVLTDAGDALLGWPSPEKLPKLDKPARDVPPGTRQPVVTDVAGLTADPAKSHLLSFGEFCAMFLCAWAPALWPKDLPASARAAELTRLAAFRRTLPRVRRALANVATYMIFDDHEISDDWYINLAWCRRALSSELGRRVIRNGLAAYAVFEAWGNTPRQFARGAKGSAFLAALEKWSTTRGADVGANAALDKALGPPAAADVARDLRLTRAPEALDWHYTIRGPKHEVVVLDTRTWRSYTKMERDPPGLLVEDDAYAAQVDAAPHADADTVFVVSPTPVLGVPFLQGLQALGVGMGGDSAVFDAEGWGLNRRAFETLLARLLSRFPRGSDAIRRGRVVVLSGDVHYGFAGRVTYAATKPFTRADPAAGVIVQLTASSLKNEDWTTGLLHHLGYQNFLSRLLQILGFDRPRPAFTRAGWANPAGGKLRLGSIQHSVAIPTDRADWVVDGTPAVASYAPGAIDRHGVAHKVARLELTRTPEWMYDLEFFASVPTAERAGPGQTSPEPADDLTAAGVAAGEMRNRRDFRAAGMEIVGLANLGDISIEVAADGDEAVVQRLWWRVPEQAGSAPASQPFPLTQYAIPIGTRALTLAAVQMGVQRPLAHAWIYRRDGADVTVLRTDDQGRLMRAARASDEPWAYESAVDLAAGTAVTLAFSRGAQPVPRSVLDAHPEVFAVYHVPAPMPGGTRVLVLNDAQLDLTRPAELAPWPVLWQLPLDAYESDGLPQGAALWAGGQVAIENQTRPPLSAAVRPRERGLVVEGRVDAGATVVHIQIVGAAGPLRFRMQPDATPPATEAAAVLSAPSTQPTRDFRITLFLADTPPPFGPVQVVVVAPGRVPRVDAFSVDLCGIQVVLVDDDAPRPPLGPQRGQVRGETDEVVAVSFAASPQAAGTPPTHTALTAETRAAWMMPYEIVTVRRRHMGVDVPWPQMPLWMGEVQLVGIGRDALQKTMRRRWFRERGAVSIGPPLVLRFEFSWRLVLAWDGPDSNSDPTPPLPAQSLRYTHIHFGTPSAPNVHEAFAPLVVAELRFGARGQLVDDTGADAVVGADGAAPDPWLFPPTPLPDRRTPRVVVVGRRERWGRATAAPEYDTIAIEFQPRVIDTAGDELIRGGNGRLEINDLFIDGDRVDPGVEPVLPVAAPPASDPTLRLPRFRVRGTGPTPLPATLPPNSEQQIIRLAPARNAAVPPVTRAEVETLIRVLVQDHYDSFAAPLPPRIDALPLAAWQETMVRILRHESKIPLAGANPIKGYFQFDARRASRWRYQRNPTSAQLYFGKEFGMPLFGEPHGYGIGQLDNTMLGASPPDPRGATADEVWSFVDNIRTAVQILMDDKARDAWLFFAPNWAAVANGQRRAVFQRDIVRRYNGGTEFQWIGGAAGWQIAPANVQPANVEYPNHVLTPAAAPPHQRVAYPPTGGVAFTPQNYGPGL